MDMSSLTKKADTPFSLSTRPRAIFFDWDNTLVDTGPLIFTAFNKMMESMGEQPWPPEYAKRHIQASCRDILPHLFGAQAKEAERIFYQHIEASHLDTLTPLKGAAELLECLFNARIPMGIISNKRGDILRKEIDFLQWNSWLMSATGSGDTKKDKPDPSPLLSALDIMKIPPSLNVWMVGDMPVDWACARAAGCGAISVGDHPDRGHLCDLVATDCCELKKKFCNGHSFLGVLDK